MRVLVSTMAIAALCLQSAAAGAREARQVVREATVNAPAAAIWRHWTTLEGLRTLFTPPKPPLQGNIELRPNGPYELYFLMDNPEGMRGGEESRIIAYQDERMLSFTWKNTPAWKIRPFLTNVVVTLEPLANDTTQVRLVQSGFGDGGERDVAYDYFGEAWSRVLNRLVKRYGGVEVALHARSCSEGRNACAYSVTSEDPSNE
jgi:uncharacterized protein YndB with AHSA1/START domain